MEERRKHRDRRTSSDLNYAWIHLPPIVRVLFAVAIILTVGWLALQVLQLVTMLTFVLSR